MRLGCINEKMKERYAMKRLTFGCRCPCKVHWVLMLLRMAGASKMKETGVSTSTNVGRMDGQFQHCVPEATYMPFLKRKRWEIDEHILPNFVSPEKRRQRALRKPNSRRAIVHILKDGGFLRHFSQQLHAFIENVTTNRG